MNKKAITISAFTAAAIIAVVALLFIQTRTNELNTVEKIQPRSQVNGEQNDYIILAENSPSDIQSLLGQMGFQLPREPFQAPDFELTDINGNTVRLSDYKGKPVLFNIWATWCPPCREEMPSMNSLYKKYSEKGFVILAASSSLSNDTFEKVRDYAVKEKFTFPVFFDGKDKIDRSYFTQSIPTSYIIDSDGMLIARIIGGIDWDTPQMNRAVEELLK